MGERIGSWAHRAAKGRSHLVESQVSDRFVTRCGREMEHQLGNRQGGMLVFESVPSWGFPACSQCVGTSHANQTLNTRSPYP